MNKLRAFSLLLLTVFPIAMPVNAAQIANEVAVEIPSGGGTMVMYGRSWRVARFIWAGFMAGGGEINRDFDLKSAGQPTVSAHTRTLVLPMIGPRVTFAFPIIAVSVGYAGFWGRTDMDVDYPGVGRLRGRTSGFGQGFYSPLLSLDVYSEKHDLVFGVGLGGFFGTSFPNLVASGNGTRVTTDENPIDTLSFHLKVGWDDGWRGRQDRRKNVDDF